MITSKNKSKFKDRVIVLDDMGDKLNKDVVYYFTDCRSSFMFTEIFLLRHSLFLGLPL